MNNNIIYCVLIFCLLVIFFIVCQDEFLDIELVDCLMVDNFFKIESEIKVVIVGFYGFFWFDYNDKFVWMAGDCMVGDMYYIWDQEG